MDEEKLRQFIRNEMYAFYKINRYEFDKRIQIRDGKNIQLGRTIGTKIGTATDQLLGFYGATPVDKPATVSDASAQGGTYNQANVQSIADATNALIDRLQELGLIV